MKTNAKRSEKRRSSEQLNLMFKRDCTDYMCHQACSHKYDIYDIMARSITLPLSYENVRFHNQKSEYGNENGIIRLPRSMTPRTPRTPRTPSTLHRSKSLPQSHTLTPTAFSAVDTPRDFMNRPRLMTNQPNQIPFISENLSTHSVNSVSSYPSILALKLSFTNQASNEAISLLSPALPTPTPKETPKKQIQNGEHQEVMSSDSSFYNNDDDDDDDVLHENGDLLVPPTPRPSANRTTRRHSRHNVSSTVIRSDKRKVTQKRKTINIISPKRSTININPRFSSDTTNGSSLLDHADSYDPPHPSVRFSVDTESKEDDKDDKKALKLNTKVPRNSQYVSYATMLQSVIEEVSEQSSLEHDIMKNKMRLKTSSDASKEFHQYKKRQEAFHKIINKNKQQIDINKRKLNIKKKKAFYNKSKPKAPTSSSLVITKNKNKNRNTVDIRRPQTSRIRVSTPMLNIKRPSNMKLFRYELNSDDTSDMMSDTTYTSTTSMTSLSNDTTQLTHSDTTKNAMERSVTINSAQMHSYKNNKLYPRRPCTIIRRAANNKGINPMVRSTSAMYTPLNRRSIVGNNKKIGLFDNESVNAKQIPIRFGMNGKDSSVSEYDMERDKFFLENKYRSYAGSELSFDYENIEDKLSAKNNLNHDLCKKEVHDAYERGFLAGYFLGVNIMQQQAKEKDVNQSVVKE